MIIVKRHFPSVLDDNTETYFKYIEGIVSSVDVNASIEFTKRVTGISVRVAPSAPKFFKFLQKDIEHVHNSLQLRMEYSKSMKSSYTIHFNIEFEK